MDPNMSYIELKLAEIERGLALGEGSPEKTIALALARVRELGNGLFTQRRRKEENKMIAEAVEKGLSK